ncbi:DUF2064 domain-containing protein [Nocardioides sp. YIM 152315]|uniref:TIGR04282 family arsenosugar biosynthesis glycosyltransferase n=1 Tax=Nocardioides sp. YIM 152315 TaxID=3031760 RepID=UPI0023DB02FC|nr:DUF2064 domain-containing protein [Nocardioides sp. YIM 152315]MDF1605538.1 DUF2064 domain-containing protein [Nocardioides sp. YIM 152315]
MSGARALVVAKAPVPGRVKTRLAADVGDGPAAELAAASLLDTIAACRATFGPGRCLLALAGDLADAVRGEEITRALAGWGVAAQRGATFAERLVNAHVDLPAGDPVVQVGMDTPQLTTEHLHEVADCLDVHDAVLGPAEDGGWWVLGLRDPARAAALHDVPMSTPTTYDDTRAALCDAGLDVGRASILRDVDRIGDAAAVAALAADGEFARVWREVEP